MRFAIMGSGAVGGYYGAKLAHAGHDVTFIARGAHLDAIRAGGLQVRSPALGDFIVQRARRTGYRRRSVRSTSCSSRSRPTTTRPPSRSIAPLLGPVVYGPDAAERRRQRRRARRRRRRRPGGRRHDLHRDGARRARASSNRPARTGASFSAKCSGAAADDRARRARSRRRSRAPTSRREAVEDGRIPIWEKFIFLVALAGFTGAARLPIGPIWQDSGDPRAVPRRRAARSSGSPAPKACRSPPTSSSASRPTSRRFRGRCGRRC